MKGKFIEIQKHPSLRGRAWISKDHIKYIYARDGGGGELHKIFAYTDKENQGFTAKWEFHNHEDYERFLTLLIPEYQ